MSNHKYFKNSDGKTDWNYIWLMFIVVLAGFAFIIEISGFLICFEIRKLIEPFLSTQDQSCPHGFFQYLLTYEPSDDYFAAIIGLLGTLISIAIPITITNISDSLKPYKDKEISQMFTKEPTFKRMIFVIVLLAIALFVWFFMTKNIVTGFFLLILGFLSLLFFYKFIRKVIDYVTATDDVILEKLYLNIDNNINNE